MNFKGECILHKKNGLTENKYGKSLIVGFISLVFAKIGKLIHSSLILSLVCGYDRIEEKCENSALSVLKRRIVPRCKGKTLKLKIKCAEAAEKSVFMNFFEQQSRNFFRTGIRSVGIFFLTAGIVIISAVFAQRFEHFSSIKISDTLIMGVLFTALSLFLILGKNKNIAVCVCESRILSFFFCDIFSVKHLSSAYAGETRSSPAASLLAGAVFGAFSYAVSPAAAILLAIFVFFLYLIFTKPENGILLVCLFLPILPEKILFFLILSTVLSDLFKIFRGKRTAKFTICSCALIIIGLVYFSAALFSFDSRGAAAEFMHTASAICFAVFASMLIRSSALADKCFKMFGMSALVSAITVFVQTTFGYIQTAQKQIYLDSLWETGIKSTFDSCEHYAAFLIAIIPFFAVKQPEYSKIFSGISLTAVVICLVFANSYYAIAALFLALVISMVIFSKYGLWTAVFAGAAAALSNAASQKLYGTGFEKFLPNVSVHKHGAAFLSGLPEFFSKYWFCGIGLGENSSANASMHNSNTFFLLSKSGTGIYADIVMKLGVPLAILCAVLIAVIISKIVSYAVSKYKSESAKAKCAASFCSAAALAIYGLFSDFLYDFRIVVLFFLLLAFASSAADSADEDFISDNFAVKTENYRE